jgi:DNA polymerase-1
MILNKHRSLLSPTEFKTWPGVKGGKYHLVDTLPKWKIFYEMLCKQRFVANDTECNGLSWVNSHIVGMSFSWSAAHSYYIPVRHGKLVKDPSVPMKDWNIRKPVWIEERSDEKQLYLDQIYDDLVAFYSNPDTTLIFHNAKFDLHFLMNEGIKPAGVVHDTVLMHNLLDENASSRLKDLAVIHIDGQANKWEKDLDEWRTKFARRYKTPKKNVHFGLAPLEILAPYAASDTHYTWAVYKMLLPRLSADSDLVNLYVNIESRLLWTLLDMERGGAVVDREYLATAGPELEQRAADLEKIVKEKLGDENVNLGSNVQVIPLLEKKGVKFTKKTKSGRISLDSEVLKEKASRYDVCSDFSKYKKLKKLKSTYVDSILDKSEKDQKIHCAYNQNVSTGRMSSKLPSLMNLPREDTTIRKAFVVPVLIECINDSHCGYAEMLVHPPDKCPLCGSEITIDDEFFFCPIDLSQIEVRLTAHYSRDPILLDVYNNTGEDVHLRTMCEIFNWNYKEADKIRHDSKHPKYKEVKKKRQIGKLINFLVIYGGGPKNLAVQISTPEESYTKSQCKQFIDAYFRKYKGVNRWIIKEKIKSMSSHIVQNHFGRYRRLPELVGATSKIHTASGWKVEHAQRQWRNYLIQGTAADLFKISLNRAHELTKGKKSKLVMPIHDEIIFYMHKSELDLLPKVKKSMEDFEFRVPIVAEVSYSETSWADKKEL